MWISGPCASADLAKMRWIHRRSIASVLIHLQRRDERFLRDVDLAELAHLLLALFLLVEELALAADVAAIAFRRHVLAQGAERFAGDDLAADRGLDRDHEHVARD